MILSDAFILIVHIYESNLQDCIDVKSGIHYTTFVFLVFAPVYSLG